jgi:hypothetical protein
MQDLGVRTIGACLAGSAALLVAIPAPAAPVHHHRATAHKAARAPKDDIATYLATCAASETDCETGVVEARAAFPITQTILHEPEFCVTAADSDYHVLTPKVTAWLKAHPEHNADTTYGGIDAALASMYPCG